MTDQSTGPGPDGRAPAPAPWNPSPVPSWYADRTDDRTDDPSGDGSGGSGTGRGGAQGWSSDTQPLTRPLDQPRPASYAPASYAPASYAPASYAPAGYTQPAYGAAPSASGAPVGDVGWADDRSWATQPPVDTLGRRERPRRGGGLLALAVVLSLLAGLVGGLLGSVVADGTDLAQRVGLADEDGADGSAAGTGDGSAADTGGSTGEADVPLGETGSVAEIAARVLPSVVSIRVSAAEGEGTGSGFVIDEEGLIVTNNHVVAAGGTEPADDIVVELANGSQASAEVVGTEPSYDIAVLRIDPAESGDLVALPFGDSDRVVVGEQVVAIGAPLGLDSTVTTGIVSALNRPVSAGDAQQTAFINAIQTDAAINPGNSGGPLVNMRGEVVGVNSAIAQAPGGRTGGSIGLGFSIPSNQAERTASELVETGVATFPVVGVLLDRSYTGEGVRIVTEEDATDAPPITPGGPAEAAGLRAGDTILAFEGRPVTESDELVVAIRAQEPGDVVTLTVRRDEDVFDVDVTLEAGDQG